MCHAKAHSIVLSFIDYNHVITNSQPINHCEIGLTGRVGQNRNTFLGDKNTKIRNASFYVKIPTYSTFVVYLTNHIIYGITSLTFNDNTSIVCN